MIMNRLTQTSFIAFCAAVAMAAAEPLEPTVWADIPDMSICRRGDTYYMTSTTMHFNPGIPVMVSTNLVDWSIASYCYETIENREKDNLENGKNDYKHGTWASSIRYNEADGYFYVSSFNQGVNSTYVFRTKDPKKGGWEAFRFSPKMYDHSLWIENGKFYFFASGGHKVRLFEMDFDGTAFKTDGCGKVVIDDINDCIGKGGALAEGSQVFKKDGWYYCFNICWPKNRCRLVAVHRSRTMYGPWEGKVVFDREGIAQGGIVDTPDGRWVAYLFGDRGAVGRVPFFIPITWEDGWPVFPCGEQLGVRSEELGVKEKPGCVADDEFNSPLSPVWQFNHNPDKAHWCLTNGAFRITTSRVDANLLTAKNTLTQRTFGLACEGVTKLDFSGLKTGDVAGLALFQHYYGFVGVEKTDAGADVVLWQAPLGEEYRRLLVPTNAVSSQCVQRIPLNPDGRAEARPSRSLYLKAVCDFRPWPNPTYNGIPDHEDTTRFYWSLDGESWHAIGGPMYMPYTAPHFTGYRFALFCYSTREPGGHADFDFFRSRLVESRWITAAARTGDADTLLVRRAVTNRSEVVRAVWRTSALGVYDLSVNGASVGADILKPGYTQPLKTRHAFTYDVTGQINRGRGAVNEFLAEVGAGWWRDEVTKEPGRNGRRYGGTASAFWCELRLTYADGSEGTVVSDETWEAAYGGPVVRSGIFEGEVVDARRGKTAAPFRPAVDCREFQGKIVESPEAARVKLRRDLTLEGREISPGIWDFAQNCAAVPEFTVEGAAGATVEILTAEMLNADGSLYRDNLRSAYAGVRYTLRGGAAETYRPRFTFMGYRYAQVKITGDARLTRLVSIPVTSLAADDETGHIVTGDKGVNRLIENIRWGHRSNYLSIPTDCPQRDERQGWTADTWVFAEAAAYNADVYGFLRKWMADARDAQRDDGAFPSVVPCGRYGATYGVAGWGDGCLLVPYILWRHTGNLDIVRENWNALERYVQFLEKNDGPASSIFGDWLAYEHDHKPMFGDNWYKDGFKAIFFVWDARAMREMAVALGKDEARYAALEKRARTLFKEKYLDSDDCIKQEFRGQTYDLYALKLGLVEGAARAATARDLIDNLKRNGNRLQTGFLGTAILMETLTDIGETELAYALLLQRKNPSWLYSVDQGATTVWERWNSYTRDKGFGPVSMNSFNHYAYGAVLGWLYKCAAGIQLECGAVMFAPHPDARLGFVDARCRASAGEVRAAWRYRADGGVDYAFSVPQGMAATLELPGEAPVALASGEWTFSRER